MVFVCVLVSIIIYNELMISYAFDETLVIF